MEDEKPKRETELERINRENKEDNVDSCKIYKPLNLIENTDTESGLKMLVAEMTEVSTYIIGDGSHSAFDISHWATFIFLFDSKFAKRIMANPNEEVKIDMNDFRLLPINVDDTKVIQAYFHRDFISEKHKVFHNNEKSNTRVIELSYIIACKNCFKLNSHVQPILTESQVIDKNFFFELLSEQTISCQWCGNTSKGYDEKHFTIYSTNGLDDDFSPTERMSKRFNCFEWFEALDWAVKEHIQDALTHFPNDCGLVRFAYCKFVFVGEVEKEEDGFKRGLYFVKKIITEDGYAYIVEKTISRGFQFFFDVSLNKELPVELIVDADRCTTKQIQYAFFLTEEVGWKTLLSIKL